MEYKIEVKLSFKIEADTEEDAKEKVLVFGHNVLDGLSEYTSDGEMNWKPDFKKEAK
tara:strand:+ start:576 stop:746 length:171 start_codon:yes stop_codon:yes gene_type:complete